MRIGFLMDPLDAVRVGHDSTFALMLECRRRGHEVFELRQEWLFAMNGRAWSRMRSVEVASALPHFQVLVDRAAPLSQLDVLFLRKDPPVDIEFLHATQLVELGPGPVFINEPSGLRAANEKLLAVSFPELTPPTLVTRDLEKVAAFLDAQGDIVLKPLDGFGGQGIVRARTPADLPKSLPEPVIAQQYLPDVSIGDKRVIVLDGEPAGAILRVPPQGQLLANMAAGGRAVACSIDARDRVICSRIAPQLRRLGLYLVGIDVIGGYLTEINVTSPTGLVEIEELCGHDLCSRIIAYAEQRADVSRRSRTIRL